MSVAPEQKGLWPGPDIARARAAGTAPDLLFALLTGAGLVGFAFFIQCHRRSRHNRRRASAELAARKRLEKSHEAALHSLAQIELLKNELESVLAALDIAYSIQDRDFRIVRQNGLHRSLFGDLQGKTCSQLCTGGHQPDLTCPLGRALENGEASREVRCFTAHPDPAELEVTVLPLRDTTGNITGGLEILRNASNEARLRRDLDTICRDWEDIFNTIDDAITVQDHNYNITRCNRAAELLLGQDRETLLRAKCYTAMHGLQSAPGHCPSCQTMASGLPMVFEHFEPHLGRHLRVKTLPRRDRSGAPQGLVHIVQDIQASKEEEEKREQLQQQLIQSQKLESIGQLAGAVAHDFNNVLSVIIGFSELALAELEPDHPVAEHIGLMAEAGEKAAALTRQLLAFSRKQQMELRPVDPAAIVLSMGKIIMRLIGADIAVRIDCAPQIDHIHADPGQIEQVLLNLALNARDAMETGGTFEIQVDTLTASPAVLAELPELQTGVRYVRFTVRDSGRGIPAELHEKIFEPFFTTKESGKGTGLGLATVHGIIRQHDGHITVDSEPGKGTIFRFFLPVAGKGESPAALPPAAPLPGHGETILLVEDNDTVRRLLTDTLAFLGYSALQAAEGGQGLELWRQHRGEIALVLTDLVMPGMNGRELAEKIRKEDPAAKVMFMSGYTDDTVVHQQLASGRDCFLQKPISPSILAARLRAVLDNTWQAAELP